MLRIYVMSTLVLIPLVVSVLFLLPYIVFTLFTVILCTVTSW
ncbi:hypothetical protein [Candidatus Ishikawella capsulata]|nr:hypothetical protein [Candidatus Ishikawaella capsulata]